MPFRGCHRNSGPGAIPLKTAARSDQHLAVDPVACDGIGLCSKVAPRLIDIDRWGYPVVLRGDLSPREIKAATRAVRSCPRKALLLAARESR